MQIVITITPAGQIQVGASEPLGNDRMIGILELAKMSVLEACKAPTPNIEIPDSATAKKLVSNGIGS